MPTFELCNFLVIDNALMRPTAGPKADDAIVVSKAIAKIKIRFMITNALGLNNIMKGSKQS